MRKQSFDGVVEAVRIDQNGQIVSVRAFERRGSTFSDHRILTREQLIKRIKSGESYVIGKRLPMMASTFEVRAPIWLDRDQENEYLVIDPQREKKDYLPGVKYF